MKQRHQRPEGKVIEGAAKQARKSLRQLAKDAGLSEGRVRQIVNGYKTEGGSVIEIVAPTETLARLADVLQIEADALEESREDVAEYLRGSRVVVTSKNEIWISDNSRELAALRDWIDAGATPPPPLIALGLWDAQHLLDGAKKKYAEDIRLLRYLVKLYGSDVAGGDGNVEDSRNSAPTSRVIDEEGISGAGST